MTSRTSATVGKRVTARAVGAAAAVATLAVLVGCSGAPDSNDVASDRETAVSASGTGDPPLSSTVTADDATRTPTSRPAPSEPATATIEVLASGSEPRSLLTIDDVVPSSLSVAAVETEKIDIDGNETITEAAATYTLRIAADVPAGVAAIADTETDQAGAEHSLRIVPTLRAIDTGAASTDDLGSWLWRIDHHGNVADVSLGDDDPPYVAPETAELLSVPTLMLATPSEPVGEGARWRQVLGSDGGAEVMVELHRMTDDDLEVTITTTGENDTGELQRSTVGTYARATHLARNIRSDSVLTAETTVTVNGEQQTLRGDQRSTRTIEEMVK